MKGVFEKSGITPKTAVFMHVNDTFGQSMAGGTLQFNEKGQNVNIKSVTLQNLDQRPKVVLPLEIAEDNLLLPLPSWSKR
jgi:hypothetical protein